MFKRPQNTMTASLTASLPQHNYEMLIDQLSKPKVIATNQNSAFKTSESTGTRRNNQQTTQLNLNIQCTETTRKRWERLQKPHGNQSSLLRHLLLLETYFRRGDLLLTPSAGPKAIAYAKSMQHRLQAYDNIPPRPVQVPPTSPQTNGTSLTDGAGPSQIIGSDEPSTVAIVPFSSHHVELDYRVVTPEAGLK